VDQQRINDAIADKPRPRLDCEKNFNPMNSTIFVLFGKYYSIMDQLGSKDSSRDF
jgi:hypothetical protein